MTGSESEVDVSYWRCCKYSHAKSLTGHLASLDWQLLAPCFQQMQTCHSLHCGKVTLRGLHPWEGSTETTADSTAELQCSRPCSSGIFCACWERTMGFGTQWTSWDAGLSLSLGEDSQDCNFRQDQDAPRSTLCLWWGGHEIFPLIPSPYWCKYID